MLTRETLVDVKNLAVDFQGELIYTSAATGDQVPKLFRKLAVRILVLDG